MFYKKYLAFKNLFFYFGHLLLTHQKIKILFLILLTIQFNSNFLFCCENLDNQNIVENNKNYNLELTKNEGLGLFIFMTAIYLAQIYFYLYNHNLEINDQLSEISSIDFNLEIADSKLPLNPNIQEALQISSNSIIESQENLSIETIYTNYYAEGK